MPLERERPGKGADHAPRVNPWDLKKKNEALQTPNHISLQWQGLELKGGTLLDSQNVALFQKELYAKIALPT